MTMQVIVSQEAEGSLELIQRLAAVGEVNHLGDGFYTVEATDNQVYDLTNEYPEVVVKVERMNRRPMMTLEMIILEQHKERARQAGG